MGAIFPSDINTKSLRLEEEEGEKRSAKDKQRSL